MEYNALDYYHTNIVKAGSIKRVGVEELIIEVEIFELIPWKK